MALYIALCVSDAAERKQLERLFDRENSKRENKDLCLYVDSFGNRNALMKTPNRYNLFIIDMISESGNSSIEIAEEISALGTNALIVLTKTDRSSEHPDSDRDYIIFNKSLTEEDISNLVDKAYKVSQEKTHLIEIRCNDRTVFVNPDELMYAVPKKTGFGVEIFLNNGRTAEISESLDHFAQDLNLYPEMVKGSNCCINIHFVRSISHFSVKMSDGTKLRVSANVCRRLKELNGK
jgi:hypothetical protein